MKLVDIVNGALRAYRYKNEIALASIAAASVGYAIANPPAIVRQVEGQVSGYWNSISAGLRPAIVHADSGSNLDLTQYQEALQLSLNEQLVRMWNFNNETKKWSFYDPRPAFQQVNTLKMIEPGSPYLIKVNGDVPSLQLYDGWNIILGSALIDNILPDLQISNISYTFLKVNDDGTTSYSLTVTGIYGQIKPDKPFDIKVLGLEGILNNHTFPVTKINNGTFTLEIPEVRLPDIGGRIYNISATADIGRVIVEQDEGNNTSREFVLEVEEPQTFTRDVVENYKLVAHYVENSNRSLPKAGWDKNAPMRIYVDEAPDKYRGMLDEVVDYLGENNVDVDFASDVYSGNGPIFIGTHAQYYEKYPNKDKEFFDKKAGYFEFTTRNNTITKAEIVIFTNYSTGVPHDEESIRSAMIEEILQSTGLTNDLDNYPGIFGQTSSPIELTEMDKEIIRLGNLIRPGTLERDVERYIRVIDTPLN